MAEETRGANQSLSTDDPTASAAADARSQPQVSGEHAAKDKVRAERRARLERGGKLVKSGSDAIRRRVASLVWLLAVLAAVVLAAGALLVALDANPDNAIVAWVLDAAHWLDGPFWKVFEFTEVNARGRTVTDDSKEALVNWGLAAVAYLVAGRILDRVIRP